MSFCKNRLSFCSGMAGGFDFTSAKYKNSGFFVFFCFYIAFFSFFL